MFVLKTADDNEMFLLLFHVEKTDVAYRDDGCDAGQMLNRSTCWTVIVDLLCLFFILGIDFLS